MSVDAATREDAGPAAVANAPAVSLVVCTRDRAAFLPTFLDAIARLHCAGGWELVIVDNGSRDVTGQLLADFARTAPMPVRVVTEPRRGLARARNAGVRAARAPIVAFTDDDCYPAPDFLDELLRVFDDPAVGYVGGRITLHDAGDDPITTRDEGAMERLAPYEFVPTGVIQGANMAARRVVLDAVGLFDPALGPGTPFVNDDVDFVARASLAGFGGGYFPGPVVAHHHRRRGAAEVERVRASYDRGRGAYFAKRWLDGPARRRYLVELYWDVRQLPPARAWRELRGAVRYLAHRAVAAVIG